MYKKDGKRYVQGRRREIGRERRTRPDKERGGGKDNPSASSFVQIDPDLDNAPPPPAFSPTSCPTSGPIQCKHPTSQLLYFRCYEVTDHGRPT